MATELNNEALRPAIQLIPYAEDPLHSLAARIINDHSEHLPDLSNITVLLPDSLVARHLRRHLLNAAREQGHVALLGPTMTTLADWVSHDIPTDRPIHDNNSKSLLLIEALLEHPDLLHDANPWSIADSLLQLFDELTLNRINMPDNLAGFTEQLAKLYQIDDSSLTPFSHEARLVYTLWQAWHEQLEAGQQLDNTSAYLLALGSSLQRPLQQHAIYLAGFHRLTIVEYDWLSKLLQENKANLFIHGIDTQNIDICRQLSIEPAIGSIMESDYTLCLKSTFASSDTPLQQRAREFASQHPASPLQDRLNIYSADNNEDEACAIDIQVREWLLAGHRQIGIVTENRRLARRVRALLERADVTLQDASGWALSTTSAAAALEAWMQCVEEDFAWMPFLDLLKSPFIFADIESNIVENATYRLEQDIIQGEQTTRGLARYRQRFIDRQNRLPDWMPDLQESVLPLFDRFKEAAQPLLDLRDQEHHLPRQFLAALKQSLDILAITPRLAADAAGQKLLQLLEQMNLSAQQVELKLDWLGSRSWLGRQLEQTHFKAITSNSPAQLMGLGQSQLQRFDALIIGGAEQEFLPGVGAVSPFFNSNVRRELGLTTRDQQQADRFQHFRRLLESAPNILITLRKEQDGDPINPSPWVAQLQSFQLLAWGEPLTAKHLAELVQHPATRVLRCDSDELPGPASKPEPAVPASQIPTTITASAYQELMNCPYQFFARRCLKLAAPEAIREALSKAEYGQLVHRCLHGFHTGINKLPGPFKGPVTQTNRSEAIKLLEAISKIIFNKDLQDNFAHRGWWYLWQSVIPVYIDWQIKHGEQWQVSATEQDFENSLDPKFKIKGRLDRLDQSGPDQANRATAILDYKTGKTAKEDDVLSGEAVQLPFYALLAKATHPNIQRIEYLKLEKPDQVRSVAVLEDEVLDTVTSQIEQRLNEIMGQLHNGQGMPAWSEADSCEYCDMQTLCRRQVWEGEQ